MHIFQLLSLLTTLAAIFAWINHRYLRLPQTMGLMAISLCFCSSQARCMSGSTTSR